MIYEWIAGIIWCRTAKGNFSDLYNIKCSLTSGTKNSIAGFIYEWKIKYTSKPCPRGFDELGGSIIVDFNALFALIFYFAINT